MKNRDFDTFLKWVSQAVAAHPFAVALLIFGVSVSTHALFAVFAAFGEQDAARLAIRAVVGNHVGHLGEGQWIFIYPGYIHMLYVLLRENVLSKTALPGFMTALSVLSSGLYSAMFFLFFREITAKPGAVLAGTVLLQLIPVFWMSSLYGFPTMVALAFFMTANWLFALAVTRTAWLFSARIGAGVGAAILFQLAVFTKLDVTTAAALFCLPVWCSPHRRWPVKCSATVGILAASVFAFYLFNRYGAVLSGGARPTEAWQRWTASFFTGMSGLFSGAHVAIVHRALGVTTLAAVVGAGSILIVRRTERAALFWILAAAAPGAMFWTLMAGNSARHNLIFAALVPMVIALPLVGASPRLCRTWIGVLILAAGLNYLWYAPSASTIGPSGRLIASASAFRAQAALYRKGGQRLASMKEKDIVVVAQPHKYPYYMFEILTSPLLEMTQLSPGRLYAREINTGKEKQFVFITKANRRNLKRCQKDNFTVVRYFKDW